jgi:hypothetical protein
VKNLFISPKKSVDSKMYFYKRKQDDFKSFYHTIIKTFDSLKTVNREVAIKFIGPGQIFGLEDSITR